jgi:hypothetical protein
MKESWNAQGAQTHGDYRIGEHLDAVGRLQETTETTETTDAFAKAAFTESGSVPHQRSLLRCDPRLAGQAPLSRRTTMLR